MKLVKESLNEKFKEESDPISDMGIGEKPEIKKRINDFVDEVSKTPSTYNPILDLYVSESFFVILAREFWSIDSFEKCLKQSKLDEYLKLPGRKVSNDKKTSIVAYIFMIKPGYDDIFKDILKDFFAVNEKFEEDSDPIKDLDIGLSHIMWEEMKDYTISDLVWILEDSYPEFDEYKTIDKERDTKSYFKIPYEKLKKQGITKKLLQRILNNTRKSYYDSGVIYFNPDDSLTIINYLS